MSVIEMRFGQQLLSSGSCFFWRHNDKTFLITNWHNVTGRKHTDNTFISPTLGTPDRLTFRAFRHLTLPDQNGISAVESVPIEIKLYKNEPEVPIWLEHPTLKQRVDVVAIDISNLIAGFEIYGVNEIESDALIDHYVSQDVFVVGFPFGLLANAPAPIWKRGSIALDPTFNPEDLPKMLIDTATREGMSGSVVLVRHRVSSARYPKKGGAIQMFPKAYEELDVVIGIYSGRHYPDLEKAQLGIVWKRSVIEDIVNF